MSVKDKPHYTLTADALARWVERQPDQWWFVDGDPRLTSVVDFPCPSDELAPAIRKVGKDLLLQDKDSSNSANGQSISEDNLDDLADIKNRKRKKTFLLSWSDTDVDWLLMEDEAMVAN